MTISVQTGKTVDEWVRLLSNGNVEFSGHGLVVCKVCNESHRLCPEPMRIATLEESQATLRFSEQHKHEKLA
jgi:hypothetical protein